MKKARTRHLEFIIGDIMALELAQCVSVLLMGGRLSGEPAAYFIRIGILLLIITLLVSFLTDCFRDIVYRGYLKEFTAVIRHTALIFACEIICLFAFGMTELFTRLVLFAALIPGILLMYAERLLIKAYLRHRFQDLRYARTLMIIASREQAELLADQLLNQTFPVFHIQGIVVANEDMTGKSIGSIPVICSVDEVAEYGKSHIIDEVLISIPGDPQKEAELAKRFLSIGVVAHIYLEQYLQDIPHNKAERICGMNVITCFNREIPGYRMLGKRLMDIAGGLAGLIAACLIGLVIGPMIYIRSPGPILFSQVRVGRNGRRFRLYKFRSMVPDAEERKKQLLPFNKVKGNMFKMDQDPRIIPGIGAFIRKTSMDEFPQFFNVLKGDMSLVGTRPPTEDEYEAYSFYQKKRLSMKPGITGLWQISGRSDITDFEEVLKLDNQYIDHWSLEMDLKILAKTVLVIMKRKGSA